MLLPIDMPLDRSEQLLRSTLYPLRVSPSNPIVVVHSCRVECINNWSDLYTNPLPLLCHFRKVQLKNSRNNVKFKLILLGPFHFKGGWGRRKENLTLPLPPPPPSSCSSELGGGGGYLLQILSVVGVLWNYKDIFTFFSDFSLQWTIFTPNTFSSISVQRCCITICLTMGVV